MEQKNDTDRLAELEFGIRHYFSAYLAPVMREVKAEVDCHQAEEMKRYNRSAEGVLRGASDPTGVHFQLGLDSLKVTGEWNSQTTEDYLGRVKERLNHSEAVQRDLLTLAAAWREEAVKTLGKDRYAELSKELGCDLAYAYVDERVQRLMVDRLVKEHTPQGTLDYLIGKAAKGSLFGLGTALAQSPLAAEIEARGEKAYRPSALERGAGKVLGAGIDAVATGGASTWASLAKFVGMDVAVSAVMSSSSSSSSSTSEYAFEKLIPKNVEAVKPAESELLARLNQRLERKITLTESAFARTDWGKAAPSFQSSFQVTTTGQKVEVKQTPGPIAPDQEKEYLAFVAQEEAKADERAAANNTQGWNTLLKSIGLDGVTSWAGNFGYVLAMLPDVLLGAFTGKSASLGFKDNLIPLASIVGGMFVKNPILKMLMMGLGAANLFNKAGKEAINLQQGQGAGTSQAQTVRYRVYPDEALNARIESPLLQGNCLLATIDRVPCSIVLPEKVVDAYHTGALPLNTLANAVLAKSDQMKEMAQNRYEADREESQDRGVAHRYV
jgi:hypothetical protein